MTVVTTLPDGRIIAKVADAPRVIPVGGGRQAVAISIVDLKRVEEVLQYKFDTDPVITAALNAQNEKLVGNVVGVTIVAGAGTTLTVTPITLGY